MKTFYLGLGTDKYPLLGSSSDLSKCESDVTTMEDLVKRLLDADTKILLGGLTTKGRIIDAIKDVIKKANDYAAEHGEKVFCCIHRSSHGTQQPDDNGDETDTADEAWVCVDTSWNAETQRFNNVIIDDEIVDILKNIDPKKVIVLVISDTCHSGSFTRLAKPELISTRRFVFPRNYKKYHIRKVLAGKGTYYYQVINEVNWILFAGSNPDNYSYEGVKGGALTTAIKNYLAKYTDYRGSNSDAAKEIVDNVKSDFEQQTPHLECHESMLVLQFFGVEKVEKKTDDDAKQGFWYWLLKIITLGFYKIKA